MKKNLIPLSLCICFLSFTRIEAQILGRLQDRINKTVEDKIVEKVGKEIDKSFENKQDTSKNSPNKITIDVDTDEPTEVDASSMMAALFQNDDTRPSDNYNFSLAITMETSSKDNNDEILILLDEKDKHIGISGSDESLMVFDKSIDRIVMINSEEGNYMILPDFSSFIKEDIKSGEEEFSFEKTGRKKDILGYYCEEYTISDDTYITNAWLTSKLDINFSSIFSQHKGGQSNPFIKHQFEELKDLFPLESTSKQKKNGETYEMKVTDISSANKFIKVNELERLDMNFDMDER